jgi:hypothetical protein
MLIKHGHKVLFLGIILILIWFGNYFQRKANLPKAVTSAGNAVEFIEAKEVCVNNVVYYQYNNSLTIKFDRYGRLETCTKSFFR